jgi:hypothetical protein
MGMARFSTSNITEKCTRASSSSGALQTNKTSNLGTGKFQCQMATEKSISQNEATGRRNP